jgi:hypothetical protein
MNIYRWYSQALRRHADGEVIVMAETPDQARQKALDFAWEYFKVKFDWLIEDDEEESEERFQEFKRDLERDLAEVPFRPVFDVVFVEGSE